MSEDNNLHIREIFSILTQGVEMIQYEANPIAGTSSVTSKIVWMDSDIYRICVDTVRPSMADRAQGKIPAGLYLRDISEVRDGSDSYQFTHNKVPPRESDNCLTLVGSERTIALELPSKFTRDWFLSRFRLLTEDILVEQEKKIRRYKFWENSRHLTEMEKSGADHLRTLLESGIQILHHQRTGKIEKSILKFDSHNLNFEIHSLSKPFFSFWLPQPLKINVYDVSEVRPGSHSLGFVKTGSTEYDSETMSMVGSENVFDLQLINSTARDLFTERLFHFILSYRLARRGQQNLGRDEFDVRLVA